MIRNYIQVAIRNLVRNKFFSAINIFGLAVSMTICMAIIMLVADQMQYDRHNTKRDRIFRVNTFAVNEKGEDRSSMDNASSPMTLRQELLENYTGFEKVVRIRRGFGNGWLEFENQDVNIPVKGFFADPEIFDVLEYEFRYGDPRTALQEPYTVVLTQKAASKLFKEENPIGQTIKVGGVGTYTVTGVLKETENKSHIFFEALGSMASVKSLEAEGKFGKSLDDWLNFWNGWTYVLLEEGREVRDVEPYFEKIYRQHIATVTDPNVFKAKFRLQSINDMTPGRLVNNPIGPSLPWAIVYFLSGLAGVIMLTSCFNFTNLSIARSLRRAKEIGVRKVAGAARWQIFMQFLSESVVVALCSLVLAFFLLIFIKPLMLQLTLVRVFMWNFETNYAVLAVFIVFATVVGVLAGFFPAVVLSGFQPVKVLKSLTTVKLFSKMGMRKALLVSQFSISLIFILSALVMYKQVELFLTKDYGFNMKDNIMIRLNNTSAQALKSELLKYPNVQNVTASSHVPSAGVEWGNEFKKTEAPDWTSFSYYLVDEDYLKNMEVALVAGNFFTAANGESNKNFIVINEEAAKALDFKTAAAAVGEEVMYRPDSSRKVIAGVVKDYNHQMLMSKLGPLALMWHDSSANLLQVRYSGTEASASRTIEKAWSVVNPGLKVDYKPVESEIKLFYNTLFGDLVDVLGVIAGLAIMISCLGLLGMATYTIETRMREISIRKVLGSSDQALVMLLSKGFLKILLVAIAIGLPAAWFINNLWLERIAYHTEIGVTLALTGILILLLLGAITIGSQTLRAAFTNPVDNLKGE